MAGQQHFINCCRWRTLVYRPLAAALLLFIAGNLSFAEDRLSYLTDTPKPESVEAPSDEQLFDSIQQGVTFLLNSQNTDGSWGSATQTKDLNIYAPIPGAHHAFRSAVTGLAISALLQTQPLMDQDDRERIEESVGRATDWLEQYLPRVRRASKDAMYNVWGHSYSIEALCALIKHHERLGTVSERTQFWKQLVRDQIEMLSRYRLVDDGWGYYDFRAHTKRPSGSPTSFTTATVLAALHQAKQAGVEVPDELVKSGMVLIRRTQKPDFSYYYSFSEPTTNQPMRSINRPGGSLGRSQACNLALRLWGGEEITNQVINVWLDRLFARNLWLDIGRKRPVPHESHFLVAGYFYYYGHWYAARSFELLDPDDRMRHATQMSRLIVGKQEKDGSWWDYPFYAYHRPYGTAMALMTLTHCHEGLRGRRN